MLKVRGIRRLPREEDRWNPDRIEKMQGTPWEPVPGRCGVQIKTAIHSRKREESIQEPMKGEAREKAKSRW